VQEALLAARKHLHQFRGQSQMSTGLTTIFCNCARMQLRMHCTPKQLHWIMVIDGAFGLESTGFPLRQARGNRRHVRRWPWPSLECLTVREESFSWPRGSKIHSVWPTTA